MIEKGVLKSYKFIDDPFKHLMGIDFFPNGESQIILNWLKKKENWELHTEDFFEQFEYTIFEDKVPLEINSIFNEYWRKSIIKQIEEIFGILLTSKIQISARKYGIGQGIGIHNDNPNVSMDYETHRLIIYLNEDFVDRFGGYLVLFNSKNISDIYKVIRPINNSYFCFEASPLSWHAVTNINEGVRYSINISFWMNIYDRYPKIGLSRKKQRQIIDFFHSKNAGLAPHSGRNLEIHLWGTAKILFDWGCKEFIVLGGLFHSIYGTSCTESLGLPLSERLTISNLIGGKGERLSYLFCQIDRNYLYKLFEDLSLNQSIMSHIYDVNELELKELLIIDIANSIESAKFINLSIQEIENERNFYVKLKSLIPNNILEDLLSCYSKLME